MMQIYRILNKENGKSYVGMTKKGFKKRYHGKWYKWTHSVHLKSAVKKYGLESFSVEILEDCVENFDDLCSLEKFYIEKFNCLIPNGYNLTRGGGSENPSFIRKYELVDQWGKIFNVENLSKFCLENELNYGAMLNMVSGISASSQGYALAKNGPTSIKNPKFKECDLVNEKTKESFHIRYGELKGWCEKMGLEYKSIQKVVRGKIKQYKDWKLKGTVLEKDYDKKTKYRSVLLIDIKTGEEVFVDNVYQFCKKKGIDRRSIYSLLRGETIEGSGFKLKNPIKTCVETSKNTKLINISTLEKVSCNNLSDFCRNRGLNLSNFNLMISGRILVYENWTIEGRDISSYIPAKKICFIEMEDENGVRIYGKNPKEVERNYGLCSVVIYSIINGKSKNLIKGCRVVAVKFTNDFYPDITF